MLSKPLHLLGALLFLGILSSASLAQESEAWKLLKKHDKNGDGRVSSDEYDRGIERFQRLDRNGDGAITEDDLRGGRGGRNPGRRGGRFGGRMLARAADANEDRQITAEEWSAFLESLDADDHGVVPAEKLRDLMPRGRGARLTQMLDRDDDGRVEIEDLNAIFGGLDANDDGTVTMEELGGRPGSGGRPERGGRRGGGGDDRRSGDRAESPRAGESAPDFELAYAEDSKKTVRLSSFTGKKPVALVFGSYTWPPFRRSAGRLTEIYERYQSDVEFFIVYVREAHAIDSPRPNLSGPLLEDPITFLERTTAANVCMADLDLPMPAIVDKMDDGVSRSYQGHPDRLYLVGKDGKISYAGGPGPRGFLPDELEEAIQKELAKSTRRSRVF